MKKQQVDRVIVEEALRLVASAWNVTIEEIRQKQTVKQRSRSCIPRLAFSYLVCEMFHQPSEALHAVGMTKRLAHFRYRARKELRPRPEVMEKILGIKWQIENSVLKYVKNSYHLLVPRDVKLAKSIIAEICLVRNIIPDNLKTPGRRMPPLPPLFTDERFMFGYLACEMFGQPSNILEYIGLFKPGSWYDFRYRQKKWWCSSPKCKAQVLRIKRKLVQEGFRKPEKAKVDEALLKVICEEVALAWDTTVLELKRKRKYPREYRAMRFAFYYVACKLFFQPRRKVVVYFGAKSASENRECWLQAVSFVESFPKLYDFLFLIRDRVRARLNGEKLPPAPKWADVKGPSVADYAKN